jgi:hypothetical protein
LERDPRWLGAADVEDRLVAAVPEVDTDVGSALAASTAPAAGVAGLGCGRDAARC